MCGCKLHGLGPGPCTCECASHAAYRREDAAHRRRVAIIDPDNREQVDRLGEATAQAVSVVLELDDEDRRLIREAAPETLRLYITPKPDEPRNLGAIVEDTDRGLTFVRQCGGTDEKDMSRPWLLIASREPIPAARVERCWLDLRAVRVLSEGVTA